MITISFYDTVAAASEKTLVSQRIPHPFTIKRIRAYFVPGSINQLLLRFLISPDDSVSTSGLPSGHSVLADYGQVDYVVGDGDAKDMRNDVKVDVGNSYVKVHAQNDDSAVHTIDVQVEIEPRGEKE